MSDLNSDNKKYLNVNDVAKLLGKSNKFVYKHATSIPGHFTLAGNHFFDSETLDKGIKLLIKKPKKK